MGAGRFDGPVDVIGFSTGGEIAQHFAADHDRRDRDFFFPEPILRETAERIPDATLRLYDGVGHPVGKTHKRRFEDDVLAFLDG